MSKSFHPHDRIVIDACVVAAIVLGILLLVLP